MSTKPKVKRPSKVGLVEYYLEGSGTMTLNSPVVPYGAAQVVELITQGIPWKELEALQQGLQLTMEELAVKIGMSRATLNRRKAEGRLDQAESDRVVRLARLTGKAVGVFESQENARQWLTSPQVALGGALPLDFAQTEVGAREVEDLLGRIEYGVYS